MDTVDFGKLTSQKLSKIKNAMNYGNIDRVSDLKASDIKIDFAKINETFDNITHPLNIVVAANLAGMNYTDFMAQSKEEQNKYILLATLMDADNDGKVNLEEKEQLMALSGAEGSDVLDEADIENLLKIVSDAGIDELVNDIDSVIQREEEEAREATHSHGEYDNGLQIDVYDKEVYVTYNGVAIEGVKPQDDGSYTFELDGQTRVFKPNDEKGIDYYDSTLAYADSTLNINKELDENFRQCGTGDCYYLATLNALKDTPDGQQILQRSISYNEDEHSYTVYFAGVNVSYTFTAEDIKAAEEKNHDKKQPDGSYVVGEGSSWYSEGDDDVLLLEMAFEQFRLDCYEGKYADKPWPDDIKNFGSYDGTNSDVSPLTSGGLRQPLYVLTGADSTYSTNVHNTLDELKNADGDFIIYAGVSASEAYVADDAGEYYIGSDNVYHKVTASTPADVQRYNFVGGGSNRGDIVLNGVGDSEGQKFTLTSNGTGSHAITISNITDDTVTLANPWNASEVVTVSREDFESYAYNISYANVEGQYQTILDRNQIEKERIKAEIAGDYKPTPQVEEKKHPILDFFKRLFNIK